MMSGSTRTTSVAVITFIGFIDPSSDDLKNESLHIRYIDAFSWAGGM